MNDDLREHAAELRRDSSCADEHTVDLLNDAASRIDMLERGLAEKLRSLLNVTGSRPAPLDLRPLAVFDSAIWEVADALGVDLGGQT